MIKYKMQRPLNDWTENEEKQCSVTRLGKHLPPQDCTPIRTEQGHFPLNSKRGDNGLDIYLCAVDVDYADFTDGLHQDGKCLSRNPRTASPSFGKFDGMGMCVSNTASGFLLVQFGQREFAKTDTAGKHVIRSQPWYQSYVHPTQIKDGANKVRQ